MPTPRKPSDHHERTGAYAHDPKRKRKDPRGVGVLPKEPPDHLDFDRFQTKAWKEIVAVIPVGIATGSDAFVVECAARILGGIRKSGKYVSAELGQLRYLIGSLGLSPADRARLGAPGEEPEEDGFAEYRQGRSGSTRAISKTLRFPGPKK